MSAAKIKKGDTVVILSGKDKGKSGEVTKSIPRDGKVVVAGINIMTRHKKPSQTDPNGGLEKIEAPMAVSKVALADPKDGKPTRVGFKVLEDGRKVRVAKRSGEVING
jgi:large subunit ribosomal protein L24